MAGVLPPAVSLGRGQDPAEVPVDDRLHVGARQPHADVLLAVDGAGQTGAGAGRQGIEQPAKAAGLGQGVVGGDDGPVRGARLQPSPQAHVGGRTEALVGAEGDDLGVGQLRLDLRHRFR